MKWMRETIPASCPLAALLWFTVAGGPAAAQEVVALDDSNACGDCIRIDPHLSVGAPDDPLPWVVPELVVLGDSTVRLIDRGQAFDHVAVFDAEGRFDSLVSRRGDGPGELRTPRHFSLLAGDSLLVFDGGRNERAHLFTSAGEYVRRFPLPWPDLSAVDRLSDGSFLLAIPSHEHPLHRVSAEGEIECSFGGRPPYPEPRVRGLVNQRTLAVDAADRVWAAAPYRYEVEVWRPCGNAPEAVLRREVEWFPARGGEVYVEERLSRDAPPGPAIHALRVDPEGRLWVFAWVTPEDWDPEARGTRGRHSEWRDTVIEVLDPEEGRVLATGRSSHALVAAPGGAVYSLELDDSDLLMPRLWSVSLASGSGRR